MTYKDDKRIVRTFEKHPDFIALKYNDKDFMILPFGLAVNRHFGWDILKEYTDFVANNTVKDKKAVFKKNLLEYYKWFI